MSKFTAEDVEDVAKNVHDAPILAGEMLREYAAHLARQSEGVSDEVVRHLEWVRDITSNPKMVLTERERGRIHRYASAVLTTVLHNRPAQEKAEPVASGMTDQDRETLVNLRVWVGRTKTGEKLWGKAVDRLIGHASQCHPSEVTFMPGQKVPPAERVRVPAGWKLVPIKMTEEMQRAGSGFNYIENAWKAVLDAAPEAAIDATDSPG